MDTTLGPHPSERVILGTIMAGNGHLLPALRIEEDDFIHEKHKALWVYLQLRWHRGEEVRIEDVCEELIDADQFAYGGLTYIKSLLSHRADIKTMDRHIKQVKDRKVRVNLINGLGDTHSALKNQTADIPKTMDSMVTLISVAGARYDGQFHEAMDSLEEMYDAEERGDVEVYMKTGIKEWDNNTLFGGLSTQGMTIIAGASGSGKTTVMNCLALGLCKTGKHVYVHGSETSVKRRLRDLTFSLGEVDQREWASLCRGVREMEEQGDHELARNLRDEVGKLRYRLVVAADEIKSYNLHVTGAGLTVERVCAEATRLSNRGECDVVMVDYLQDLSDSTGQGKRIGDQIQQVSHKSGALKELAAQLGIPVVVGAQISGEKAGPNLVDPRPQMWDVQHSSRVHQDSQEVFCLYRDDVYAERVANWKRQGRAGVIEIISRKKRIGRLGTLELSFDGPSKWVGNRWFDVDADH
tara:strand:- start:2426 stop:3829 length:1404 start_codon:yes stop_codon:yes gene_type:complete